MNLPTTPTSRPAVRVRRAAAALLVATLAVSLVATPPATGPAVAQEVGVPGVPGSGGPGGGNTGGSGIPQCVQDAGFLNGQFIYLPPYHGCDYPRINGSDYVGPIGFEVWRMYGRDTTGQRAQSVTVSRANPPQWNQVVDYSLFAPHPADANLKDNGGRSWGPWATKTTPVQRDGRRFRFGDLGGNWVTAGQAVTSATGGRYTTDTPFRRIGSCTDLGTDDSVVAAAFDRNHPDYDDNAHIREAMFSAYEMWANATSKSTAMAVINAAGSHSSGRYPTGPDDIIYDDGLDCSSGMDYVVGEGDTPVRFTTCWMPVEARYVEHYTASGQARASFTARGGPRYSTAYPLQVGKDGNQGYREARQAIYDEVRSRPADTSTPAQPYSGNIKYQPARNAHQAAKAASQRAQCTSGLGSVWMDVGEEVDEGMTGDHVEVLVDGPTNFLQVGGQLDPATFTATRGDLVCDGGDCTGNGDAPAPEVVSLDFQLQVRGTGGYRECTSSSDLACDFAAGEEDETTRRSSPAAGPSGRIVTRQEETAYLYRATATDQKVAVEVVNATATVREYRWVTPAPFCPGGVVTGWDGDDSISSGDQACVPSTPYLDHVDRDLPVTVINARELTVTGGVGLR